MSWLLPYNRKLRHLEGISVRNLTLSKPASRKRSKTIDDDSVPTTLTSPGKLLAQRDGLRLEHSRSSADLKSAREDAVLEPKENGYTNRRPIRPGKNPLRRRSTLNWVNTSSSNRQKLLEEAVVERRPDSFFSLHKYGASDDLRPFYISEVKEQAMNADFRSFNLQETKNISRDDTVTVKLWARVRGSAKASLLLVLEVHLASLVRVGKTLDTFYHPLPDNCVIFHLSDGLYTSFFELPNIDQIENEVRSLPPAPRSATFQPRDTSSFDALMKCKNLIECVEDAASTLAAVTTQIECIIEDNKSEQDLITSAGSYQTSTALVNDGVSKLKFQLTKLKEERTERVKLLQSRRVAIKEGNKAQAEMGKCLSADKQELQDMNKQKNQAIVELAGQRRRIAQQLLDIFPIDPIEGKLLCFTISGHYLPNAKSFDVESNTDEDSSAAALGLVGYIVMYLEQKLEAPVPYPITFRGSTSDIFDPLSPASELGSTSKLPEGQIPTRENSQFRIFPLYQKGTLPKSFRWAVYLLNKDIEELMSKHDLRVVDARNTLANLKYLLTVLSSGTGDMPQRKVGDIKGLKSHVKRMSIHDSYTNNRLVLGG